MHSLKQFVSDLKLGTKVDSVFRLRDFVEKPRRDGSLFLILELSDRSGKITAKIWDDIEKVRASIVRGGFYLVKGEIIEYNSRLEIKIEQFYLLERLPENLSEEFFLPPARVDLKKLEEDFQNFFETNLKSDHFRRLWKEFRQKFGQEFALHPGAVKVHHAFPGGLMAHTLSMAKLALLISQHYQLESELLLCGVLLHDAGKLREFSLAEPAEMSLAGGLTGHIVLGLEIFQELLAALGEFPEKEKILLKHLIISHHGEKEFGSIEPPKTAEAYALHLLDLLDSRMAILEEIALGNETTLFSDYNSYLKNRILLEKNIFAGKPGK